MSHHPETYRLKNTVKGIFDLPNAHQHLLILTNPYDNAKLFSIEDSIVQERSYYKGKRKNIEKFLAPPQMAERIKKVFKNNTIKIKSKVYDTEYYEEKYDFKKNSMIILILFDLFYLVKKECIEKYDICSESDLLKIENEIEEMRLIEGDDYVYIPGFNLELKTEEIEVYHFADIVIGDEDETGYYENTRIYLTNSEALETCSQESKVSNDSFARIMFEQKEMDCFINAEKNKIAEERIVKKWKCKEGVDLIYYDAP